MNISFVEMVEGAAKMRHDPVVPRDFIIQALGRIEGGKEPEVERYPLGKPTLIGVYKVASRLQAEAIARTN